MRKRLVLVVAIMLLSLSLVPAAFASTNGNVNYDYANHGWAGNGHHNTYWSGVFFDRAHNDYSITSNWYNNHFNGYIFKDAWTYFTNNSNANSIGSDGWKYESHKDKYGNMQYSRTKGMKIN